MSKYFNQAASSTKGQSDLVPVSTFQLEQLVNAAREAESVATEVAQERLQECKSLSISGASPLLITNRANTGVSDSYRTLRTRILRSQVNNGVRTLVLTSTAPGEGKTLTSMNLGMSFAQLEDCRTLVIDADLRTKGLSHLAGCASHTGLSDLLSSDNDFGRAVVKSDIPNLFLLPAGRQSTPPPELFSGRRWRELLAWCHESFKVVLVDAPPAFPLADYDAMAGACDGTILIVRACVTNRDLLQKTVQQIDPKKLVGAIYNAEVEIKKYGAYAKYYGATTTERFLS